MDLILNTTLKPFIKYNNSFIFRKNNIFLQIEYNEIIDYIINYFNDKKIDKETLISLLSSKYALSLDDTSTMIENLLEVGILTESCPPNRFFTNISFFSLYDNINKSKYQEKLSNSHICILGLGGSTMIIQQLLSLGVRKITGVDFDVLEEKNFNRQVIFEEADLGLLKVDALKKNINKINPYVDLNFINKKILSKSDVDKLIDDDVDLVILALDEPMIDSALWIHESAKEKKKPVIAGGVWGDTVTYVLFDYRLNSTPCYKCMLDNSMSENNVLNLYTNAIKGKSYKNFNTTISFTASILSGICVTEIAKLISGYSAHLSSGELLQINTSNWEITRTHIQKNSHCSMC